MQAECLKRSDGCIFNGLLCFFFFESHTAVELTLQAPCHPVTVQSKLRAPGSVPGEPNVISE